VTFDAAKSAATADQARYDAILTAVDVEKGLLRVTCGPTNYAVRALLTHAWAVGTVGWLQFDSAEGAFAFIPYVDQRLRRAPQLDDPQCSRWGWRIGERTFAVKAPTVPGVSGAVVGEDIETISLDLPRELLDYCVTRHIVPRELLRAYIGDLCALVNRREAPREDGYGSNGQLARWLAREYCRTTFGWLEDINRPPR
jgi:hypothetical protein